MTAHVCVKEEDFPRISVQRVVQVQDPYLFIRLINKEEIVRRGLDDQPTVMPFPCHAKNFLSNLKFTYGFSS